MGRGDLSGEEWGRAGPILPSERRFCARPSGNNWLFLNGMLHVLRVGCPWRDMAAHRRLPEPAPNLAHGQEIR